MGEVCYNGDPSSPENSTEFVQYQSGFKMGCFGLVGYSAFMSICSGAIEHFELFQKFGIRRFYITSYILILICCLVMFFLPTKEVVLSLVCVLGVCFAVLFTIPLLLLSRYHANNDYRKKVKILSMFQKFQDKKIKFSLRDLNYHSKALVLLIL